MTLVVIFRGARQTSYFNCKVLCLDLYSLTLVVVFNVNGQIASFLQQCLHTNGPTGMKECLIWKCYGLFFSALKSASRWYDFLEVWRLVFFSPWSQSLVLLYTYIYIYIYMNKSYFYFKKFINYILNLQFCLNGKRRNDSSNVKKCRNYCWNFQKIYNSRSFLMLAPTHR